VYTLQTAPPHDAAGWLQEEIGQLHEREDVQVQSFASHITFQVSES